MAPRCWLPPFTPPLATLLNLKQGEQHCTKSLKKRRALTDSPPSSRSQYFFLLGTFNLGGSIVGPILSVLAIQQGRWFAIYLGIGLIGSTILAALLMPETRDTPSHGLRPLVADEMECLADGSLSNKARALLYEAIGIARYQFIENKLLGLSLISLIFTTFGKMLPLILDKYAHYRFDLSWEAVRSQTDALFSSSNSCIG